MQCGKECKARLDVTYPGRVFTQVTASELDTVLVLYHLHELDLLHNVLPLLQHTHTSTRTHTALETTDSKRATASAAGRCDGLYHFSPTDSIPFPGHCSQEFTELVLKSKNIGPQAPESIQPFSHACVNLYGQRHLQI